MLGRAWRDRRCHGPVVVIGVSIFLDSRFRLLRERKLTFDTIWAIRLSGRTMSEAPPGRSVTTLASNIFWLTAAMVRHLD